MYAIEAMADVVIDASEIIEQRTNTGKPRRNLNFSEKELLAMIREVVPRREALFSKASSNNQRKTAWKEVVKAVNAFSVHERSRSEIRKKLYDLRYRVKKKAARDKLNLSGRGGEPIIPVYYKPAEAAILPFLDHIDSPDDGLELEGVSDIEEVTHNDSNDSSEMMVVIGEGGESISIYEPSSRKETSKAPSSDPLSHRGIKRELYSIIDSPLDEKGVCSRTQNCKDETKSPNFHVSKQMPRPPEINLNKNPDLDFFISILPDMVELNASQKRRFKQKVLQILDDICNEGN